jgi:hypothetical protein
MAWIRAIAAAYLLLVSATAIAQDAAQKEAIRSGLTQFNKYAKYPIPVLNEDQINKLINRKIVRIREKPDDPELAQRIIGFIIIDQPRDQAWLGARDPHFESHSSFTEKNITPLGKREVLWYQYFDVPRLFTDRHWLVTVEDNHEMAQKTNNIAWEHPWDLTPNGPERAMEAVRAGLIPGITEKMAQNAIYTPVNNGAWVAIKLSDNQTLFGFHASTVVGGRIPDKLVADYAMWSLNSTLEGVAERSVTVFEHYDKTHAPVPGGDGLPIPTP